MTMNVTSGTTNLSSDNNRRVTIEVVGGRNQNPTRMGVSTITVPYSCFSKTLQGISRRGGTVISVETTPSQAEMTSSGQRNNLSRRSRKSRTRTQKKQRDTRIQRGQAGKKRTSKSSNDQPMTETFLKRLFTSK